MFLVIFFVAVCRRIEQVLQVCRDLEKVAEHWVKASREIFDERSSYYKPNAIVDQTFVPTILIFFGYLAEIT